MGRFDDLVEATGGIAQLVGPREAWQAAAIVSDRFPGSGAPGETGSARLVANWFRLTFLNRAIINRDRTAVIGVGGTRLSAVLATILIGAWAAPRLSKPVLVATTGLAAAAALRRGRLRRLVWLTVALRRDAPDAVLVGEFASRESGAGIRFAAEMLDAIGTRVTLALTVQGAPDERRTRSLLRMYERLEFEVAARRSVGTDDLVLMVRRRTVRDDSLRPALSGS